MEHYRCMDCSGVIPWYDAFILGRSRCPACHEATVAWEALEAGQGQAGLAGGLDGPGVADEVSQDAALDRQVTVPLEVPPEIRQAIQDFSPSPLNRPSPAGPAGPQKLQPVLLELTGGRLECGRCGALAILVRLWHGEGCDDPAQFAYQAVCQACWEKERTA